MTEDVARQGMGTQRQATRLRNREYGDDTELIARERRTKGRNGYMRVVWP